MTFKLRILGNHSLKLIERQLVLNNLNCHNYEAVGHLVANSLGVIFTALKDGQSTILCFTAPVYVNEYLKNKA
jgi:hypothetical protein